MELQLRFFASLREALGSGETLRFAPGQGPTTAGALRRHLVDRGGAWAERLGPGRPVRCAVNQQVADESTPLPERAEVAFFPPVTGG